MGFAHRWRQVSVSLVMLGGDFGRVAIVFAARRDETLPGDTYIPKCKQVKETSNAGKQNDCDSQNRSY